jgi:hypothetical protein
MLSTAGRGFHDKELASKAAVENEQQRPSDTLLLCTNSHSNKERFLALKERYPFDAVSDQDQKMFRTVHEKFPKLFGFGHVGREIIDNMIKDISTYKEVVVLMEVGVWLGQSAARWLNVSPSVRLIAIDPFAVPNSNNEIIKQSNDEDLKSKFNKGSFRRALAQYTMMKESPGAEEKVVTLTGLHPQAAAPVFSNDCGPAVDIFYLDGGKVDDIKMHMNFVNSTLEGVLDRFPDVIVCGDDWNHGTKPHMEAFQSLINNIAAARGKVVKVGGGRTWMMINKT